MRLCQCKNATVIFSTWLNVTGRVLIIGLDCPHHLPPSSQYSTVNAKVAIAPSDWYDTVWINGSKQDPMRRGAIIPLGSLDNFVLKL